MSDLGHVRSEIRDSVEPRTRFVLELGLALHRNGVSAYRLEGALTKVADTLDLRGRFFSTPTALIVSLDDRTHLLRADQGDVDLDRMCSLDEVGNAVIAGALSPEAGSAAINEVIGRPAPYSGLATTAAFAVASAVASIFLAGSLVDVAVGATSGLLIGALAQIASRSREFARLFLITASLLSAGVAWGAAAAGLPVSLLVCTIAGLIAFVPGLSLTVAMSELATGHLASGTARLAYVAVVLVQMGLGVALAERLGTAIGVAAPDVAPSLLQDTRWLIFAVLSNGLARAMDRPAANFLVPSIFLLVPGSVGLRSVSRLLEDDVLGGVHTAFEMSLIAIALVGGMLVANLLLPARRHL